MLRDRLSDALSDVVALRSHAFQIQEAYSAECLASKVARDEQSIKGWVTPFCLRQTHAILWCLR